MRTGTSGTVVRFTGDTRYGAFVIPAGTYGKLAVIDGQRQPRHRGAQVAVVTADYPSVWAKVGREVQVVRRTTGVGEVIRHAVAKSTGATIIVERTGPGSSIEQDAGWATVCANHATLIIHETRAAALSHAVEPEGWCADCERIANGKADRITTGLIR
jgi:hypothetical protein